MKIIASAVTVLVLLGMAWGLTQWLGDGAQPLSGEWFENSTAKIQQFQSETSEPFEEILPEPSQLNLPGANPEQEGSGQ